MDLFSERNGFREPKKYTYVIEEEAYRQLVETCHDYQKYLVHLFPRKSSEGFIVLDEKKLRDKLRRRIPKLFVEEDDQYAMLDLIEYFADNIKGIYGEEINQENKNYKLIKELSDDSVLNKVQTAGMAAVHLLRKELDSSFVHFQNEINSIFSDFHIGYELTDRKRIERITDITPAIKKVEENDQLLLEEGVHHLVERAVRVYASLDEDREKAAADEIWDAFERIKTYYVNEPEGENWSENKKKKCKKRSVEKIINDIADGNEEYRKFFNEESCTLTYIGNHYEIRHSEKTQKPISDERLYEYLFLRCLALVNLMANYLE